MASQLQVFSIHYVYLLTHAQVGEDKSPMHLVSELTLSRSPLINRKNLGIRTDERSAGMIYFEGEGLTKDFSADSYVLLDRHRQVNRPTLPPTRDRLERHRQLQENSEPAFDDRHHDRERRDLRDDRQESDSDRDSDSGNDNDEGAQKKRKRSSGKVCTNPRQEGFYPASWKKVFARAKDLVYIYLLLQNLFPERDEFKSVQISSFLHDAMLYVVDKLGIPLEKSKCPSLRYTFFFNFNSQH